MSSFQLSLSPALPQNIKYSSKTPVHASFSRENDALAFLWHTGYLEVYEMHTRLGPGRGKVLDPVKLWSGFVTDDSSITQWRQVVLKHHPESSWTITALGSNVTQDVVGRVKIEGGLVLKQVFELEKRSVRILDDAGEYLQSTEGEIYQSACLFCACSMSTY